MTIRQIILLTPAILAITQTVAMDRYPNNQRNPYDFVNERSGIVIVDKLTHHGRVRNKGLLIVNGELTSGNIPQQQHPQYYPQYYPQNPYTQPIMPAYAAPQTYYSQQTSAQDPRGGQSYSRTNALYYAAQNRTLTPKEQSDVQYVETFQSFSDLLPKQFQRPVDSFSKLNQGEKAILATSLAPRLKKDEKAQDLERVMHAFTEDTDEKRSHTLAIVDSSARSTKSFFFAEPTNTKSLEQIAEAKSWHTPGLSADTIAVEQQLVQLTSTWKKLEDLPKIS